MVQFPQKDKMEAERVISEWFSHQNPQILLKNNLEKIKDSLAFGNPIGICSLFHSLRTEFSEFAIAKRIVSGDVHSMITNLQISARFGYLLRVSGGEKYSGDTDCLHVFDLLKMLAIGDLEAIESLTNRFPAPFSRGAPETIMLCNAIYACLDKHPDPGSIKAELNIKKGTKFFVALHQCLLAIIEWDIKKFFLYLDQLLRGNYRQNFHLCMEKIVCLEAHAIANIWILKHKSPLTDLSNREIPWDNDFYNVTNNSGAPSLPDLKDVSPVIDHWLKTLPEQLIKEELISELKENLLKKIIRRLQVAGKRNKFSREFYKQNI